MSGPAYVFRLILTVTLLPFRLIGNTSCSSSDLTLTKKFVSRLFSVVYECLESSKICRLWFQS